MTTDLMTDYHLRGAGREAVREQHEPTIEQRAVGKGAAKHVALVVLAHREHHRPVLL